jgi:hypothetical protein
MYKGIGFHMIYVYLFLFEGHLFDLFNATALTPQAAQTFIAVTSLVRLGC